MHEELAFPDLKVTISILDVNANHHTHWKKHENLEIHMVARHNKKLHGKMSQTKKEKNNVIDCMLCLLCQAAYVYNLIPARDIAYIGETKK